MQDPIHQNHQHFEAISDAGLSPVQAQVIEAWLKADRQRRSRKAGIHRTTIHNWIRNQPQFKAAVRTAQSEYAAEVNDSIHELAAHALLTLHDLLRDPATPHAVRLKTALAILQRPHAPTPAGICPAPSNRSQSKTKSDATPIAAATEPATPPTQPAAPAPIARCAPCPCGSGRKYKRCCGVEAIGLPVTRTQIPRSLRSGGTDHLPSWSVTDAGTPAASRHGLQS